MFTKQKPLVGELSSVRDASPLRLLGGQFMVESPSPSGVAVYYRASSPTLYVYEFNGRRENRREHSRRGAANRWKNTRQATHAGDENMSSSRR